MSFEIFGRSVDDEHDLVSGEWTHVCMGVCVLVCVCAPNIFVRVAWRSNELPLVYSKKGEE